MHQSNFLVSSFSEKGRQRVLEKTGDQLNIAAYRRQSAADAERASLRTKCPILGEANKRVEAIPRDVWIEPGETIDGIPFIDAKFEMQAVGIFDLLKHEAMKRGTMLEARGVSQILLFESCGPRASLSRDIKSMSVMASSMILRSCRRQISRMRSLMSSIRWRTQIFNRLTMTRVLASLLGMIDEALSCFNGAILRAHHSRPRRRAAGVD